jgi:hypothetical protein
MGDNNLFCVIFQKGGDGLKPIYYGQISGDGASSVINRGVSASDSASGSAMPGNITDNQRQDLLALFSNTGGTITFSDGTIGLNPLNDIQNKLNQVDPNVKQEIGKNMAEIAAIAAGNDTDENKALKSAEALNKIITKIPLDDQQKRYMEMAKQALGSPVITKLAGSVAGKASLFAPQLTKLLLENNEVTKELSPESKETLIKFSKNTINFAAKNAKGIFDVLVNDADVDAAKQPENAVGDLEGANELENVSPEANNLTAKNLQSADKIIPNEDVVVDPNKAHEPVDDEHSTEDVVDRSAVGERSTEAVNSSNDTKESTTASKPPAAPEVTNQQSDGGRRTKRKSKHHRRRKNKSKNKKR